MPEKQLPSEPTLCNHMACQCAVTRGETYCGDWCRREIHTGMENVPHSCGCGHTECRSDADPAIST